MRTANVNQSSKPIAQRSGLGAFALVCTGRALVSAAAFVAVYVVLFGWLATSPNIDLKELFGAIFNLFGLVTGFLVTFYLFLAVSSNAFIDRVRKTKTFRNVLRLMAWTAAIAGAVTLYSLSLSVYDLGHPVLGSWAFWVTLPLMAGIGLVAWNAGWSLYLFGILVRDDLPPPRIPGG